MNIMKTIIWRVPARWNEGDCGGSNAGGDQANGARVRINEVDHAADAGAHVNDVNHASNADARINDVNHASNADARTAEGERASTEGWLGEAAGVLRAGGLVAFPTETVYGLGADARSSRAVAGIFEAKGRPADNPLIVHIARLDQVEELVLPYPPLVAELMKRFWPGPLTIVLPARDGVLSPLVTAGLPTVGVRMPAHPVALALLQEAGCPVAAPSANRSGRPSPTEARHVQDDLSGLIDGIVDGGATGVGLESTVVELADERTVRILRPGGVTAEELRLALPGIAVIGERDANAAPEEAPRSPGMKYTHYAPRGELRLVQGEAQAASAYIRRRIEEASARGERTGVLAFSERASDYSADLVLDLGSERRLDEAAKRLYAALRQCDDARIDRIWAESCPDEGIGRALMNRMVKAAGNRIDWV